MFGGMSQNFEDGLGITTVNARPPCRIRLNDCPATIFNYANIKDNCTRKFNSFISKNSFNELSHLSIFVLSRRVIRLVLKYSTSQIHGKCFKASIKYETPKFLFPMDNVRSQDR